MPPVTDPVPLPDPIAQKPNLLKFIPVVALGVLLSGSVVAVGMRQLLGAKAGSPTVTVQVAPGIVDDAHGAKIGKPFYLSAEAVDDNGQALSDATFSWGISSNFPISPIFKPNGKLASLTPLSSGSGTLWVTANSSIGAGVKSVDICVGVPCPSSVPTPTSTPAPTPLTSGVYNFKVFVLKYFPLTADGQTIDTNYTGDVGDSYTTIRQRTVDVTNNLVADLSRATKYKGYLNPNAQPSLTYQVIKTNEYTQPVPIQNNGTRRPDFAAILGPHDICNLVDNQGVREIWLWAYQGPNYPGTNVPYLNISESKMAGPFGDISNSTRLNDLPVCQNTYRLYTFNYGRGTSEAMESWGHQIESELDAVDTNNLFRSKFQGPNYPQTLAVNGRCGSVHNPPNARNEYDRNNPTPQMSDCLNWSPDGLGTLTKISCTNWQCTDVSDADNTSLDYMIWNWQNLPGLNNTLTYQGRNLRNWWDIHGNFDVVMRSTHTLLAAQNATPVPTPLPTPISTPRPSSLPTPTPTPFPTPITRPTPTPFVNSAPVISDNISFIAYVGQVVNYLVQVTDADSKDVISVDFSKLPPGLDKKCTILALNKISCQITGKPKSFGLYAINITAHDNHHASKTVIKLLLVTPKFGR